MREDSRTCIPHTPARGGGGGERRCARVASEKSYGNLSIEANRSAFSLFPPIIKKICQETRRPSVLAPYIALYGIVVEYTTN